MTISPSELMKFIDPEVITKKPYTNLDPDSFNMQVREVYCPRCVYRTRTALPDVHCGYCDGKLLTSVKSHQEIIDNELGRRNSNSAQ